MIYNLFPVPVGHYNIGRSLTIEEITYIKQLPRRANQYNETSSDNYIFQNGEELNDIKKFCEAALKEYVTQTLDPTDGCELYITQCWTNYTEEGQHHHEHKHKNSIISGVFYPQAVEQRDNVVFFKADDTRTIDIPMKGFNDYNSTIWKLPVKTGDLYLFPSHMYHTVPEVGSGADDFFPTAKDKDGNYIKGSTRISLSFNTFVEGELGKHNSLGQVVLSRHKRYG